MSSPNPSSVARRLPWLGAMGLGIALATLSVASAGELYQWKDANGVTHYSDAPPPAGADYQNRTIRNSGTASVKQDQDAAEAPAGNAQCTTARANLELLQGEGPVGTDTDKDGKPDAAFSAEQRAAQTQLAEAAIKVHCAVAAGDGGDGTQAS
ncbi:DUF4124 domain-containing protein [Lysobacter sp. F6437]|uniref:DUF4124 domain-containing protein n=1 Tax=Lysobacter sp. F6437 TaxID=3459296 RepID=UPI00403D6283